MSKGLRSAFFLCGRIFVYLDVEDNGLQLTVKGARRRPGRGRIRNFFKSPLARVYYKTGRW
jgi:hypothetical protein